MKNPSIIQYIQVLNLDTHWCTAAVKLPISYTGSCQDVGSESFRFCGVLSHPMNVQLDEDQETLDAAGQNCGLLVIFPEPFVHS